MLVGSFTGTNPEKSKLGLLFYISTKSQPFKSSLPLYFKSLYIPIYIIQQSFKSATFEIVLVCF